MGTRLARRFGGNRGMVLIGTYIVLSALMVYSGTMTMRTATQTLAINALTNRHQALDLARGATEQLRDDFFRFFQGTVYQNGVVPPATAMAWLDSLGASLNGGPAPVPAFVLPNVPVTPAAGELQVIGPGTGSGDPGDTGLPRLIPLATGTGQAWIASICARPEDNPVNCVPDNLLDPRVVTIEARATDGPVVKWIRTNYVVGLGVSDAFRYAYFMNNYGWFTLGSGSSVMVAGEVRSNGDLRFQGTVSNMRVMGDLYASRNPQLVDPTNPGGPTAQGTITGGNSVNEFGGSSPFNAFSNYWANYKRYLHQARPSRRLTQAGQPAIGIGAEVKRLDRGEGYDTEFQSGGVYGNQQQLQHQTVQDMPYLGDVAADDGVYRQLANEYPRPDTLVIPGDDGDAKGSSLRIQGGVNPISIDEIYKGLDGIAGNSDDHDPVVLVGTALNPIEIHGPVIIPGDVIIRGRITGQGTIYSGRNVHLVGGLVYQAKPVWPLVLRDTMSGKLKVHAESPIAPGRLLGTVCSRPGVVGKYFPPGVNPASDPAVVAAGGCGTTSL